MLLPPPSLSDGLLTSRASWRCSKESRGARVASRKDLRWDHNDNNKDQTAAEAAAWHSLAIFFLQFRAQLHFYHNFFGFFFGGNSAKALLQEERDNSLKLSMLWRIDLTTWERERELAGHEWALDLVDYLLTLVELAIACVKFSLYKKIGICFWF